MNRKRHLIVIAKHREFDEEKWKQLLSAFAFVLHERRKRDEREPEINEQDADTGDER